MSTATANQDFVAQDLQQAEFDYQPTPVIVPISVALGLLSASSLLGAVGILLAFLGILASLSALWTISKSDGMYNGWWAAICAFLLSFGFGAGGIGSQIYAFNTEVPEGYERISFSQDISAKGFVTQGGQMGLHPDVAELIDKQVFLKGYMYPQRQTEGLREFLLLKDTGECCFGGQPKPTDMILVVMNDKTGINHRNGRVAVSGTLRLTSDTTPEGLQPVYALEADHCETSRSIF